MSTIAELKRELQERRSKMYEVYDKLIEKLEDLAYKDELTGLLNRRGIIESLDEQIAADARRDEHAIVLMMDLDNFKTVNDTLGHDAGDILLQEVAKRLRKIFRAHDKIGRLGGDECMVICEGKDCCDQAEILAKKAVNIFQEPFPGFERFNVTNSVGVSIYPKDGRDTSILMKRADISMYIAKKNKSGHHIFDINDKVDMRAKS